VEYSLRSRLYFLPCTLAKVCYEPGGEEVEDFSSTYADAIHYLLSGDKAAAVNTLASIPGFPKPPGKKSYPLPPEQVRIFRRDGFTCRYCGRKTVFRPVLRALSAILPVEFPWQRDERRVDCHLAYWRDFASCDHVRPLARGDNSSDENLVTACCFCSSIKQNWTIDEMGWKLLDRDHGTWDGLTSLYPSLVTLVRAPTASARFDYYRLWLRALNAQPKWRVLLSNRNARNALRGPRTLTMERKRAFYRRSPCPNFTV
jgi:5-methylcytosine-specific restriction endonuclease McrA